MLRQLYLSPVGIFISALMHLFSWVHKPFMVYGFYNRVQSRFFKKTRVSSSAKLVDKDRIDIADGVWIGHYSLIDGIGGVEIGKCVNIASHSCIYSHSSHNSIRLLGDKFIEVAAESRPGYVLDSVKIGEYTFIGTSCVILPGTKIGKGCVVGAGSVVKGSYNDYSIISGNPAVVVGDTRHLDQALFEKEGIDPRYYYDQSLIVNGKFVYTK